MCDCAIETRGPMASVLYRVREPKATAGSLRKRPRAP